MWPDKASLSDSRLILAKRMWTSLLLVLVQQFTFPSSFNGHSFIIIREVLILTLSIFIPMKRCISLYPRATGMLLNEMINRDHNIQSHPCYLIGPILSLGTVFPRTLPREDTGTHPHAENIDNVPAMMQNSRCKLLQTGKMLVH